MRFEVEETGGLESIGNRERDSMFVGRSPRTEKTEIDELEVLYELSHRTNRRKRRIRQKWTLPGSPDRLSPQQRRWGEYLGKYLPSSRKIQRDRTEYAE